MEFLFLLQWNRHSINLYELQYASSSHNGLRGDYALMKCFICGKNDKKVMLLEMPVEAVYDGVEMRIIGNANPNEFICLPCVGFQFDLLEREKAG